VARLIKSPCPLNNDHNPRYRSTVAAKGVTFLPKRACNVLKCETAVALKLTGNSVEPLKFIVPRKSEAFQVM